MIKLPDNYRILVDSTSYNLYRYYGKVDKNGQDIRTPIGYYTTLQGALKGFRDELVKRELNRGEYSVYEAIEVIRDIDNSVKEYIDNKIPEAEVILR